MTSTAPISSEAVPERDTPRAPARPAGSRWAGLRSTAGRHRTDLIVCLIYLLFAGWLTHGLWPDPANRVLALNPADQTLYEWFLATDSRILLGDFSLLSDRLNAPDGINLMANTTVIALGTLFAPITLLAGAATTFALLALLNLAGTAFAWYLLFSRTLGTHRVAAGLGAALCGFGPGIISQSNSHLHMTAQWLVPLMVWLVVRMLHAADPAGRSSGRADWRRVVTSAVGLAATVTVQVFVGEEVLFLTALALAIMTVAYALARPGLARRALPAFGFGLGVAALLGLSALAYPLWFQFAGPQGVADGMFSPFYFSADLASWTARSPLSAWGDPEAARLSTGAAEYNTFLGWPLLLVAVGCAGWLLRRPLTIACVAAGVLMAGLSLGPQLVINGVRTETRGPYALLHGLPVVDGALPMRFALALLPLIATVLAMAVDRALNSDDQPIVQLAVPAVVAAALVSVIPAPLPTTDRQPVPEFISGGHWRECVKPGGVLVPVPLPTPPEPWPMRWAAAANAEFALPEGFFIGPYGRNGTAAMGTYKQPTSSMLAEVAKQGQVPTINDDHRRQAQLDARVWNASCVVLADGTPYVDSLRTTLEGLYGPSTRIADAWIWRVG